jgi:signal transduction histidine kinase
MQFRALLFLALIASWSHSWAQSSQATRLDVSGFPTGVALPQHLSYAQRPRTEEASAKVNIDSLPSSQEFIPLASNSVQFGYSSDEFWFSLDTVNSGPSKIELILTTGDGFLEPLRVFESSDQSHLTELLSIDADSPYPARPLATPKITVPISWDAGEEKTLLIYAVSNSGFSMQLALIPESELATKIRNIEITFALITGILGTLILVNLFHFLAAKRLAHLFYAIQEAAVLLFLLHGEGLAFKYLWPDSPAWNAHATMVFGHLTNLSAGLFALYFLGLRYRAPAFFKIIFGINAISALMLLATPVVGSQFSNQAGLLVSGFGAIILLLAGVRVWFKGYKPARFYVAGWAFLAIATALFFLSNFGFISLPFAPILSIRVGILMEALLLSYALSDQLRDINQRADKAQRELIIATQASLKDQQEKAELEKSRLSAEKALLEKEFQVAKERHDIRQPIYSLRLALLAGKKSNDKIEVEVFQRALDHMEQLLSEESVVPESNTQSIRSFGELFVQLQGEFENEAQKLNTQIAAFNSFREISVPLLPLKRVLSNLLANAIRHSGSKKILLGLRKTSSAINVLVDDNGIGMGNDSATQKGQGLGMQIISELCSEHDWKLNCTTTPNKGTRFIVSIPL